jgi:hypothetical protein
MFPEGEFCEWDLDRSYSVPTIEVYAILNQVPSHGIYRESFFFFLFKISYIIILCDNGDDDDNEDNEDIKDSL